MSNIIPVVDSTEIHETSPEIIASSLSQQYDDIQQHTANLFQKIFHFGCSLAIAEQELERRNLLANRKAGQGMQAWLSKNCPNINYKTAMRWKTIVTKSASSLGCSSDVAFRVLSGEVTDVKGKLAKRRDEIFSAKSQRGLMQMLFNFAAEDSGSVGRPSGTTPAPAKLTAMESARQKWALPISIFEKDRAAFYKSAPLLPIDEARMSLEVLKGMVGALEKRCKEGR